MEFGVWAIPSKRSLSSRLASRLSFLSWRSISALMRFCSFCSSDKQHAIFKHYNVLGVNEIWPKVPAPRAVPGVAPKARNLH